MERVIAVNSNCYHGYGIFECLEGIHKAGFHYVELTATKGWTEHVFPDQSFEFLESVKDKMEELFLTPIALSGHCNLMDRERLQDFIMNIRLAGFFGCQYIVSSVGRHTWRIGQRLAHRKRLRISESFCRGWNSTI